MNTTTNRIEWETRTSTSTIRQNAKCKCGEKYSRVVIQTVKSTYRSDAIGVVGRPTVTRMLIDGRHEDAPQCACKRPLYFRDVNGTVVVNKPCNAKCTGSIGHVCECSCGGKNHGASFGG